MKIKYLYIIAFFITVITACEKDEDQAVASTSSIPTFSATATDFILLEDEAENEAVTFSYSSAEFGFSSAKSYEIQFSDTTIFDDARKVTVDTSMQKSFTVAELNSICTQLGLEAEKASDVYARIRVFASNDLEVFSEAIKLQVTPYLSSTESLYADLYMVGPASEAEWDESTATPMFRELQNSFVYTFTGNFNAGELKLLGNQGAWQPQWGSAGENQLAIQETGNDDQVAGITMSAGYYSLTVNIQNMSYSITEFDESEATDYSEFGISGDFNAWNAIEPMSNTELNPHVWSLTTEFTEFTKIKFRPDGEWWGTTAADKTALYANSSSSGADIEVEAGKYLIRFNDLSKKFIFLKL